ncbi:hypothetical protein KV112_01460 [Mycolicibacter sp. MYC123]|uniref:Uncharacterized protein n=2 Tax=[Mycobacterium] zoologicum TaxID=2872311 RepID=A0ABU5YEI3_9MYCO|nr:hypothetical protein [Mycolicibacter sp. MYC123]
MDKQEQLDDFRREVNWNLAMGPLADVDLPVTSDEGGCPVVVALAGERLAVVFGRVRAAGGFVNLFVREDDGGVRMASIIGDNCAVSEPGDAMTGPDVPAATATIGMFLDYVALHPQGIVVSAAVGQQARARDAKPVEFAHAV